MAFSGFGAQNNSPFGGASNNNKFGGFGSTGTGFGGNATGNTSTGFGGNTGGGLFGSSSTNNNTTGGSTFGGFGNSTFGSTNNNNAAAGNSSGLSLFGASNNANNTSQPSTGGFGGGFGSTNTAGGFGSNNNNASTSAFGATNGNNAGSSLFGGATQNKPAFGAQTGGGLFGSSTTTANTSTGFGANNTGNTGFGGFGQSTTGAFGQQAPVGQNPGTPPTVPEPLIEQDGNSKYAHATITCKAPYDRFSLEELRLADYNAGRRYGNANGQAGTFGQSTGFGGFGQSTNNNTSGFGGTNSTGGGLFGGGNTNNSSPFGGQQNNATSNAFGSGNTGGGLFGSTQNTNTGGGLFGSNNNNTAASAPSGGLFGSSTTTGGFGSNTNTGGGLFGNTQNQQEQKPAFGGGFGTSGASTGGSLFGGAAASSTPFGQQNTNNGGGLFGSNANNATNNQTQQPAASGGLFGNMGQQNQNNAQTQNAGGSLFGGGFGQNQQANNAPKPGGLFGNSGSTGGGLFGSTTQQQTQTGGGLFGNTTNNTNTAQASGGLFGAKPAAPTGGLFGNATNNTPAGGSLFGQNQSQPQQGGLFGQNNNNQTQNKPSLFGNIGGATGGSLFGGNTQNNQSAFGNSQQQQQQPLGGSLFGNSQQQSQPQNQQQSLTASLAHNPYGNDQLFANLGTPSPSVGPLATPLSGAQRSAKRSSIIPAFKINPSASMRLITPQKSTNTYGLSYSTYGTPGSAQSFSTSRGNSLLGSGGLNRPLSKSLSTSNLRTSLSADETVLAPGAFTPNHRPYGTTHSIRKLKIDRSLRTDLFGDGDVERQQKRVSFGGHDLDGAQTSGGDKSSSSKALVRVEDEHSSEPTSEELGLLRAQRQPRENGNARSGIRSERESRGNELAIVPEDEQTPATEPRANTRQGARRSQTDQAPGEYYMSPTLQELRDMSRDQLKSMTNFVVGRVGIAKIEFSKVDLTAVPLEQIIGGIVKLNMRSATVYESGASTPPKGKGLNVPSVITLENSWPRSNGGLLAVSERKGPRFDKHIERLKRVSNTDFISYDSESGEWTFSVQHFTTYGLDDNDEPLSPYGNALTDDSYIPSAAAQETSMSIHESSMMSHEQSNVDDTFEFKKGPGKSIPGGFGDQLDYDDASGMHAEPVADQQLALQSRPHTESYELEDPFRISRGSQRSPHSEGAQDMASPEPEQDEEEPSMVGTYPAVDSPDMGMNVAGVTPVKQNFDLNDDWAAQLQRTVSPRKHDRQALRELQANVLEDKLGDNHIPALGASTAGGNFSNALDIMNSLWGGAGSASVNGKHSVSNAQGFKWPYSKRARSDDDTDLDAREHSFHDSVKPRWTTDGTLIYGIAGDSPQLGDGSMMACKRSIVSQGKDIRFAALVPDEDVFTPTLESQLGQCKIITRHHETPAAHAASNITFASLASQVVGSAERAIRERHVWTLASILFDPLKASCAKFMQGVPDQNIKSLESRIRRDAVLEFWTEITSGAAASSANSCTSSEEKALAHLSAGDVEGACIALIEGRNYHLATIVAQMPGDEQSKQRMRQQIEHWREQNVLSEMPMSVRALYAILSGETCTVEGKTGAAEDRAPKFALTEYLNLDWRRALGLRLYFGHDDLPTAVQKYLEDVADGKELVRPKASFKVAVAPGSAEGNHEDTLMGLLRLYAQKQTSSKASSTTCQQLLDPLSVSGSPLNARLAWQLATTLRATHTVSSSELPDALLDSLSQTLASQLELAGHVVDACHVLLHFSSSEARRVYILDLLCRRAASLGTETTASEAGPDSTLGRLTQHLKIPATWIWSAKAQYAASMGEYEAQASHLLQAGDKDGAHNVVCRILGPRAIVSLEYDSLREVLGTFIDQGKSSATTTTMVGNVDKSDTMPENWRTGGQVYFDYIHLMDLTGGARSAHQDTEIREDKIALLKRLGAALPTVLNGIKRSGAVGATAAAMMGAKGVQQSQSQIQAQTARTAILEERVAVSEMADRVRMEILALGKDEKVMDDKAMERLPVAEDGFVKQGVRLTGLFYMAIGVQ